MIKTKEILRDTREVLGRTGFNITKYLSNDEHILEGVHEVD